MMWTVRTAVFASTAIAMFSAAIVDAQSFSHGLGTVSRRTSDAEMSNTAPIPGLDSALSDMARSEPDAVGAQLEERARLVQVEIHLDAKNRSATRAAVARVAEITKESSDGAVLQAWIRIGGLEDLAAIPGVGQVRRPARARALGLPGAGVARSEGSAFFDVRRWHDAGFRGDGVTVGVIDIAFLGYRDLLGDELPAAVAARNFVDGGNESDLEGLVPHGAAVAEIIHDVAPAARLALARVSTPLDFLEATEWLVEEQKVDVISTSIGFFHVTPGDGTGFFADVVRSAVERGVLWVTAAGNSRQAHWGGDFADADGDNRLDFVGGDVNFGGPGYDFQAYFIPSGFTFWVFLRWNDWTEVNQDYDLYIYRFSNGEWHQQSAEGGRDRQNGRSGEFPIETASVRTHGDPAPYGFQIRRVRGDRPVNFDATVLLVISETESSMVPLNDRMEMRSLPSLADSPDAVTVAAIEALQPFVQQEFSSEGPVNGPGGSALGGRVKPDIGAYDGVSTTSYGPRAFYGTSAAAPHVAGAAALVRSAFPHWSPAQVRDFLAQRAIDLGPPGKDNIFGDGRLSLGAPPTASTTPTHSHTATRTNTATPTPTPTITRTPTNSPTPGPCYGDCNGNGRIEITEIVIGVRIALGLDPAARCVAHDSNRNGAVEINELIRAIRAALFRCIGQP